MASDVGKSVGDDDIEGKLFAEGSLVAGKYRIERRIAEGGVGVVVAARHVALDQRVAIKYLKPKWLTHRGVVDRFEREARLTAQMKSEHVVRVHDVGSTAEGVPYIVMELLTGKDLGSVVQLGPLPITRAVDLLLQACDALAEAHALHIVHRDIKPENLFLADRPGKPPVLKLIDFGISKLPPKPDEVERRTTGVQERFGTALYMSPEQLQSSGAVDARSDVWSLGIVLHELLTGQSAFDGDDMPRLCASILNGEPHTLRAERPTAPEGLEAVILKCLQKRPERRYRNVAELAQDLVVYGPVDAEQRVKGIREIVVRSGASIRPPTPATAMTMQLLPNIEPPVVSAPSVRAMDIVGERHAPKLTARTTALIALSVVIAAVIVVVAMRAWHGAALPAPAAVQSAAHTSSVATIPTAITTETVLAPSSTSPVRHQQSKSMPPATIAVTTMTTTPVASTTSPTASSVAAPTVSSNATPTATASASAQPTATTDPVTL